MKVFVFTFLLFSGLVCFSQDTSSTFYETAIENGVGQKTNIERDWGREVVCFLGTIVWKTPSGKELDIKIVTTYQQLTKANGFNDRSVIALVKADNSLIKTYDLVKKQNLPIKIVENMLIVMENGEEVKSPLPKKFSERFCIEGLTCFSDIKL